MNTVTLNVKGMSCGHCVRAVETVLDELDLDGKVDLKTGTLELKLQDLKADLVPLKDAIAEEGFEVS